MPGSALSAHEREEIRVGIETKESVRSIARRLGRSPSTISREVSRNGGRTRYRAAAAERRADRKRARPKAFKVSANPALRDHVERRLAEKDSPTTIARELVAAGGITGQTISPETIYRGVYAHGSRGLAAGLHRYLHRARRCRKHRHRNKEPAQGRKSPLGEFNLITKRPAEVEDRRQPGHWEGDLIIGAANASAILTLVERTSRFNLLGNLDDGYSADAVLACLVELFERVPAGMARSLTWDQGREMARHADFAAMTGIDVYFAEPHHPWQRGSNEAFNGLLRRYVGKGTDLTVYSQSDLHAISHRINTIPRRLHHWESAKDRYDAAVALVR
jgi:IS30 family transposase